MKFAIVAVVVLALAVATQASVLRFAGDVFPPLSYTATYGSALSLPAPYFYPSAPVVRVMPEPFFVHGEGVYVAKTPGSEHVAPLPGHNKSALSINL